jgi:hypothetical protein
MLRKLRFLMIDDITPGTGNLRLIITAKVSIR